MKVKQFVGGSLLANGYVVYKEGNKECYIIDPGYNANTFIEFVKENKLSPLGIIFTHHHYDHITAAPKVANELGLKMYIHIADMDQASKTLKDAAKDLESFESNHIFKVAGEEFIAIHTPGHTKGGVCLLNKNARIAFTGDTVFATEIGITDLEDGSSEEMADSLGNIINNWPDDIMVYSGHGPAATMKSIKENNQEFKDALEYAKSIGVMK